MHDILLLLSCHEEPTQRESIITTRNNKDEEVYRLRTVEELRRLLADFESQSARAHRQSNVM